MISAALQTAPGETAPQFTLPSVQGGIVDLAAYRGRRNVVIWFSRLLLASVHLRTHLNER